MAKCIHPDPTKIVKAGYTTSGNQRHICRICGAAFSCTGKPAGRPPVGKKAMSGAERQRRSRRKKALDRIAAEQLIGQAQS